MINGDAREFIDGLHYGDERFFFTTAINISFKVITMMASQCWNYTSLKQIIILSGEQFLTITIIQLRNLKTLKFSMAKLFGKLKMKSSGWIANTFLVRNSRGIKSLCYFFVRVLGVALTSLYCFIRQE